MAPLQIAARLAAALLPLLGRVAPLPENSLVGKAAPGNHILLEKIVAKEFVSDAKTPLRVRSAWPVSVLRYDQVYYSLGYSPLLAAGEGAVLVTSNCDTVATTAVPVVEVRQGSVIVRAGDGRDAAAAAAPFLAPGSFDAAWYEEGWGLYPEGELSEEERALLASAPPLVPAEAPAAACTTRAACDARREELGVAAALETGAFPTKGCFRKKERVFWGTGGSRAEITDVDLPGAQERLWCAEPDAAPVVRPICLSLAECKERSESLGIAEVKAGNHPTKGCFRKNDRVYWGTGGSVAEMAERDLPGAQERLWCGEGVAGEQLLGDDCEVGPAADPRRSCRGADAHCRLRTGVCNNKSGLHEGRCRKRPEVCSRDYKPVCGCDQETYSNECRAHAAGVSVSREGTCEKDDVEGQLAPGDACEVGPAADPRRSCEGADAHCRLRTGVCNNKSGLHEGICRKRPEVCSRDYKPVCGCDQETYSNQCRAHAAGVSVSREGTCDPSKERAACLTKRECDARRQELGIATLDASPDHPSKGCFRKGERAYWSAGSPAAMAEEELPGQRERLWCGGAGGTRLSLQRADVTAAVQAPAASSGASSLRWMLLSSLLRYVVPSNTHGGAPPPREGRALDTCSYNVEILLAGCNDGSAANIEVSAPRARTIDSRMRNKDTETYALREIDGDYAKDYKHTATLVFPENRAAEVASVAADRFTVVPAFDAFDVGRCAMTVPGRPFVDSDGRGLLAPRCAGAQCEGRVSSWSEGKAAPGPSLGNVTRDGDLGGEWTRNALGEHASVASFAAFSIALMSNNAPSDLVEDALNAALDEVRHAKISFDIASGLVGRELGPGPLPPSSIEFGQDRTALAVAVAREGCVDETLSALAAAAECELIDGALEKGAARGGKYRGLADDVLAWIRSELSTIAVDEGNHSALAWRTLGWICSVDAEACEVAKRRVLNEGALTSAFRHRFDDFEGPSELLEQMLVAWTRIYTSSQVFKSEDVGVACIAGHVEEVSDHDNNESRSLISLLVENISHRLKEAE